MLYQQLIFGEVKKHTAQDFVDLLSNKNSTLNLWLTSCVNFVATIDKCRTILTSIRNR